LTALYQKYQQQKHLKAIDRLERTLFHGSRIITPDVPPPDLAPDPWPEEATLVKFLRTLPPSVQELYGLEPAYPEGRPPAPSPVQ
jgi:hypothetical protein